MTATGSPQEASTSLRNLFIKLGTEGENLKGMGVDVYDKEGRARPVQEILFETIAKAGGEDVGAKNAELTKLFDLRAVKSIAPLVTAYNDAMREGKDGMKAMRDKVADATAASGTWADRQVEATMAQQSSSAILSGAWEQLVSATSAELVPAIQEAVPHFPALAKTLGGFSSAVTMAVKVLGGFVSFLEEKGLIASTEAFKAPKSAADVERMNKEVADLEAKGDARTPAETAAMERMREALRTSTVATPLLGEDTAKPKRRGFAGIGDVSTPLTGIDAVGAVMRLKDPKAEEAPPGAVDVGGGHKNVDKTAVTVDTSLATAALSAFGSEMNRVTDQLASAIEKLTPSNI